MKKFEFNEKMKNQAIENEKAENSKDFVKKQQKTIVPKKIEKTKTKILKENTSMIVPEYDFTGEDDNFENKYMHNNIKAKLNEARKVHFFY